MTTLGSGEHNWLPQSIVYYTGKQSAYVAMGDIFLSRWEFQRVPRILIQRISLPFDHPNSLSHNFVDRWKYAERYATNRAGNRDELATPP